MTVDAIERDADLNKKYNPSDPFVFGDVAYAVEFAREALGWTTEELCKKAQLLPSQFRSSDLYHIVNSPDQSLRKSSTERLEYSDVKRIIATFRNALPSENITDPASLIAYARRLPRGKEHEWQNSDMPHPLLPLISRVNRMDLAKILQRERLKNNWEQRGLSEESGVPLSMVAGLERANHAIYLDDALCQVIVKICNALSKKRVRPLSAEALLKDVQRPMEIDAVHLEDKEPGILDDAESTSSSSLSLPLTTPNENQEALEAVEDSSQEKAKTYHMSNATRLAALCGRKITFASALHMVRLESNTLLADVAGEGFIYGEWQKGNHLEDITDELLPRLAKVLHFESAEALLNALEQAEQTIRKDASQKTESIISETQEIMPTPPKVVEEPFVKASTSLPADDFSAIDPIQLGAALKDMYFKKGGLRKDFIQSGYELKALEHGLPALNALSDEDLHKIAKLTGHQTIEQFKDELMNVVRNIPKSPDDRIFYGNDTMIGPA